MPTKTFKIKNRKNTGLVMNDRELLDLYFYGIDIVNFQGTGISSKTLMTYIKRAQSEFEKIFSIKLLKQLVEERSDYYRDEFRGSGYVNTKFNVFRAISLSGYLGENQKQLEYPIQWLTSNKVNGIGVTRQIIVVPNSSAEVVSINAALFAGSTLPHLGLINSKSIGSYWKVKYITGWNFKDVPFDLIEVIGKRASCNVFNMIGDYILGAGITSQSVSLDGLSQSSSSSGYGTRIATYEREIKEFIAELRAIYAGITIIGI